MNSWDFTPYYQAVRESCLNYFETEKKPDLYTLLINLLDIQDLPMHCPVHHYIMPAALLTVCRKLQGQAPEVLQRDSAEALKRAQNVLGGFCGYYGTCGSAVGLGIFWSLITDSSPYSTETWGYANRATGQALLDMAAYGGPRCCKRTAFITAQSAAPQIKEVLKLDLALPQPIFCKYHEHNPDCLLQKCPYYPETGKVDAL